MWGSVPFRYQSSNFTVDNDGLHMTYQYQSKVFETCFQFFKNSFEFESEFSIMCQIRTGFEFYIKINFQTEIKIQF